MSSFRNRIRQIENQNEQDLKYNRTYEESWHWKYRENNEIYISGISKELNEGDIIVVFSQYGEVIDIEMPWNEDGNEHFGYCLLTYKDPRSCVLAIDNFNGIELNGSILLINHSKKFEERKFQQ